MKRNITGYHKDKRDDWVAELDCCHGQHVRNNPPFTNRPWIESVEGRAEKLRFQLECIRCDRFEFPDNLASYNQTPDFDEETVPAGLLKDHSTKSGVWGMIRVGKGELRYTSGSHTELVRTGQSAVIVPNMLHSVSPNGNVKFFVEFFRRTERS